MKKLFYALLRLFLRKTMHSDFGELYSYEEFNQYIDWNVIVYSDGIAFYADEKHEYGQIDNIYDLDKKFTHVMWYNK